MVLFAPLTFQMNLNFRAKKVEYIFYCTTGWQSNFGEYIALKIFGQKSISSLSNKFTNCLQYNNHDNHFWENLFLLSNYLEFCRKPPEDCTGCPGKFWTEYWAIFQSLTIRLGVVGLDGELNHLTSPNFCELWLYPISNYVIKIGICCIQNYKNFIQITKHFRNRCWPKVAWHLQSNVALIWFAVAEYRSGISSSLKQTWMVFFCLMGSTDECTTACVTQE